MTETETPAPAPSFARSLEQRMDALERANRVRTARAALKRRLKRGEARLVDVIRDGTDGLIAVEDLETAKVFDVMLAAPTLGRVKVNRILTTEHISPSKTIGGLSARQRAALVDTLTNR